MAPKRTKIGLISDTHGWLDPFILEAFKDSDLIVHAGDIGAMDVIDQLETVAPVSVVRGNIDGGDLRFFPLERVDEVGGRRIAVLHIAGNPKRPNKTALDFIRRESPDVIVVGHSHVPVVGRVEGCLWINPGAAGKSGFHDLRFAAILWIEPDGTISMDRVFLGGRTQS